MPSIEPSITYRELTLLLLGLHSAVILACIAACHRYVYKNHGLPSFLRYWVGALSVVLAFYLNRVLFIDYPHGVFYSAWEGILSNLANLFLLFLAQDLRHGELSVDRKKSLVLAAACILPVIIAGIFSVLAFPGIDASFRTNVAARLLIRLPSALFSVYALLKVGEALRVSLVTLRMASSQVFYLYGFYQVLYLIIPALEIATQSTWHVSETLAMNGSFVFKLVCSAILISAAAEIGKRRELWQVELVARRFALAREKHTLAEAEMRIVERPIDRAILIACNDPTTRKVIDSTIRNNDLIPISAPEQADALLLQAASCKFGAVAWDTLPYTTMDQTAQAILSNRKECLLLFPRTVHLPSGSGINPELYSRYESNDELEALLTTWIHERIIRSTSRRHWPRKRRPEQRESQSSPT